MKLTTKEIDSLNKFKEFCENFRKLNKYIDYTDQNAKFKIAKQEFFIKNNIGKKLQKIIN